MLDRQQFYIDGKWCAPAQERTMEVLNPATDEPFAVISSGTEQDVDRAVAAARSAFAFWGKVGLTERLGYIRRIVDIYQSRLAEMGKAISQEMGAPIDFATHSQAEAGLYHARAFLAALDEYRFEELLRPDLPDQRILHEPIGVCGLITPWNWPMNQLALKVIPAIATGCTVVLKPSEIAPISSILFAEFVDAAGLPAGVFNLVNGEGAIVGEALSRHRDVDMISFTGSTRGGAAVSRAAAATVKRVSLELGGKSPFIVFADADVESVVARGVMQCFNNTGQSCNAPTRMLVDRTVYDEAVAVAEATAEAVAIGQPDEPGDHLGPLASHGHYARVQDLIDVGIKEGARVVVGGLGRPDGFEKGSFVRPTVFADVDNTMTIAQEEVFGPVLTIIPFSGEDEAIAIANDTRFGLAAFVETADPDRAQRVARQLRVGMVQINGTPKAAGSPFGGYKQSGNGREGGRWGLEDYLEVKLISG
ncbi:aldehyde dehydrogenase family protein [Shinella sp. BE166]|uniref:aldehyde dehydrogenase family protein n=1 Tax=Shinella sp. BE166 TaxID=3373918 RepID=UPI003EB9FE4C